MKKVLFALLAFVFAQVAVFAQVTVTGEITANTTWTKNNTYLLNGFVYVKNGATLTIEPGTVIKGDKTNRGTLIITRGAKINANGTKDQPIVFTSNQASPKTGDWGGVVILGKASTNQLFNNISGVGAIEGDLNNAAGDGLYGGGDQPNGPDDNDNSGVLRYVRIEYPGVVISQGNEINGLTMGGVGRGTTIEYVQVSYSNDDSFEWFGGTVNCRYLISYRGVDDDFDTDFGYSGHVQFALAVRDPNVFEGAGDSNGIESDNNAAGNDLTPKTKGTFSNFTIIGPEAPAVGNTFGRGARLRRNTEQSLFNSLILGNWPNSGIRVEAQNTADGATAGRLEVKNTHIAGVTTPVAINSATFDIATWFATAGFGNTISVNAADLQLADPYNLAKPNAVPKAGSPVLAAGAASFTAPRLADPFFIDVTYAGAFGEIDWSCGWSKFEGGSNTCPFEVVSGNITQNTTWRKGITYLLNGYVYVKEGATLTIQPGVTVKGDKTSRGTLIITRGSKIIADGTRQEPIVFTSNQASPKTGDWGGLVLLGKAATNQIFNNISGLGAIEGDLNNAFGDGLYGGGDLPGGAVNDDNSGILRYVRIEYPGIVISQGNEINGLTMGGVGNGTTIDYVQVSYSNDDSFEWFGGTVNASHLISYRGVDDDFDTDFGYSGNVQFAFAVRDPNVFDGAGDSNGIESDNNAAGNDLTPKTRGTFSNFTIVGPETPAVGNTFGRGARLRRNTEQSLFNSVILGTWPNSGIRVEAQNTADGAIAGRLEVKNTHIAGVATPVAINSATFDIATWFATAGWGNAIATNASDVQLAAPYLLNKPSLLPTATSPVFNSAAYTSARLQVPFFDKTANYRGAFGLTNGIVNDWTCQWANFADGSNLCTVSTPEFADFVNDAQLMPTIASDFTNLQIDLKESLDLTVSIYGMGGEFKGTAVSQRATAGTHTFGLDVNHLAAGMYFVQIQAGPAVKTEKLIVVR